MKAAAARWQKDKAKRESNMVITTQAASVVSGPSPANVRVEGPEVCPICHHAIEPLVVHNTACYGPGTGYPLDLQVILRCPRTPCHRLFIVHFRRASGLPSTLQNPSDQAYWVFAKVEPQSHREREFQAEISRVSPRFTKIYDQSAAAESADLDELCGPGYRKALEFLIKDYAKSLTSGAADRVQIEKTPLGGCIENFISDPRIKSCAKRAAWLGNDETHYLRKWPEKDVQDLKKLIELTVHWLSAEIITRDLESSMPESDPPKVEAKPAGE